MAPAFSFNVETGSSDFPAKLTKQVIVCSIIAACGGLMFGYDLGISGGVTSMDAFLIKFFPDIYEKKHRVKEDNYCKYDNEYLQLFTSSLYLAAIVSSFGATFTSKKFGRKITIQAASVFFLLGAIFNTAANHLAMLIVGRLLIGAGVGFGNQAVPLFISEIAPARYRGGLNICFQLLITIGILCANVINFATSNMQNGWRISLGGAAVPALILLVGSLLISDTPTSLIERGKKEEGLEVLRQIRGVDNVEKEYKTILHATEIASQVNNSFKNLLQRSSRPQLVTSSILQMFQQFTGVNVIIFYAPLLFQTIGFGSDAALLSAVVTGSVNVLSTLVASFTVDRFGRKFLLVEATAQMLVAQTIVGVALGRHVKAYSNSMPANYAVEVVIFTCVFVSGFAWSWGPLAWLIPSEIFPVETRNSGFFIAVGTNMLFTFLVAQVFFTLLCRMRAGIFFFFSAWIIVMYFYSIFFLPETKGVPIDEMNERVWKKHWFWKRFFDQDEK
ncbi:hypothetical protein UlMin_013249 [Ulmus minor]